MLPVRSKEIDFFCLGRNLFEEFLKNVVEMLIV